MGRFEGFADGDAKFFRTLAKKNDRDWFQAHKTEFEEGWNSPMKLLLSEVSEAVDKYYPHCDLDAPKVFRIFRDVRFSKDKTPYKTHLGGFIPLRRSGRKATDLPMALYFQVGATPSFGAAGHYMMEPHSLEHFRVAVADEKRGKELTRILATLDKKGFPAEAHERLKRVPKAYDEDHPRAELLKQKGLVVRFPEAPTGVLATPKLVRWLADGCKASAALVEWLAFATA